MCSGLQLSTQQPEYWFFDRLINDLCLKEKGNA